MSFKSEIPVTFKCPKCPSTTLYIEDDDDLTSEVSCNECGVVLDENWGQLRERARETVKDAALKAIKNAFGKK